MNSNNGLNNINNKNSQGYGMIKKTKMLKDSDNESEDENANTLNLNNFTSSKDNERADDGDGLI